MQSIMANRCSSCSRRREPGFTLVELLVVIAILGILAAVVTFSVRGISSKGEAEAYGTEARTLRTAEEAYCAKAGHYGDLDQLMGAKDARDGERYKFLSDAPSYHQILIDPNEGPCGGTGYTIVCDVSAPDCGQGGAQPVGAGLWEPTGSMILRGRNRQTATLLSNGKVLAAGGVLNTTPTTTAELYDPVSGTWSLTGDEAKAIHQLHTATRLADGRVLVVGGYISASGNAAAVTDVAEIYNPATDTWMLTGSLNRRRFLHSAILLPDGRVLVAGGRTCYVPPSSTPEEDREDAPPPAICDFSYTTDTAEIWDPTTGQWTLTGRMNGSKHTTSMAALPGGRVIVPGGFGSAPSNSADIYDVASGQWTRGKNLIQGRQRQGAIQMPDGMVMVVSGSGGGVTVEEYEPDNWSIKPPVSINRFNFFWAVVPDGRLLVAGGSSSAMSTSSEIYDPANPSKGWKNAGRMLSAHGGFGTFGNSSEASVLTGTKEQCGENCGKVLIFGDNRASRLAQLYNPGSSLFDPPDGSSAPPNDSFANAQLISGGSGSVSGDNINATEETGEPNHGGSGSGSVWYRWTAPTTGSVVFDTAGSEFDTLLGAYTGPNVILLAPQAQNNDDPDIAPNSRISFQAVADTEYHIAVDGFGSGPYSRGPIRLNWSMP